MKQPDTYVPAPETMREAFGASTPDDVTFLVGRCLEVGAWDHAIRLCEVLGHSQAPAVRLSEAVARFVGGELEHARALVDNLLLEFPEHLSAQFVRAQMLARTGDREGAKAQLLGLLDRYPDYPGAHGMFAALMMPGAGYRQVLATLHERLRPRCYLEIGVDSGATLALAHRSDKAIGVDPVDRLQTALPPCAQVFWEESDQFFASHQREELLGARRVDLAFIDGMHRFENALADFANAERWAHAGATIVLHDCVPILPRTAARERGTKFWVGDTWKVVPALAQFRPDLRIRTVLTAPSGLVVVRRLNPGSAVLRDRFDEIVASQKDASCPELARGLPPSFGALGNDEHAIREALS